MRTPFILTAALVAATAPLGCRREPNSPRTPSRLEVLSHPQGEQQAGATLTPTVQVAVKSGDGTVITTGTHTVTIAIASGTGAQGAVLGGTLTRTTSGGIAVFDDLVIEMAGSGYRLVVSAAANGTPLESAMSAPFTVKPGAATRLAFATQPSNTVAGTAFANPVRVIVTDDYGNLVQQSQSQVTLEIDGVMPAAGDSTVPLRFTRSGSIIAAITPLAGTLTAELLAGIATFPNLRPRNSGDYNVAANLRPRLVATASGLAAATSERFTVTPAPASRVWVAVPPCEGVGCLPPFPPAATQRAGESFVVSAYLLDSLNNRTNSGSDAVSLALGANPGGAQLTSSPVTPTTNGRATFNVSVSQGGSGYTLVGSATGMTSVASLPFDVTAPPPPDSPPPEQPPPPPPPPEQPPPPPDPGTGWAVRDSLPEPRNSMFAAESGGRVYVAAGTAGFPNFHNTLRVYDPATNAWSSLASADMARAFSATNSAVVNGVLHVVAGNPSGSCTTAHEAYTIAANSWAPRAPAPRERCHAISVAHNGQVYVLGGWNTSSSTRYTEVDVYNPATNSWSAGVPLPAGTFRGGMAAVVHNAKLYVIGGTASTSDACTNTVLVFDFATGTWGTAASMGADRCSPAAAVAANGRIYVAGGANDSGVAQATVESYDPATNSWRSEPAMSTGRQGLALVRVADRLYAIGGSSGSTTFRLVESLHVP